METKFQTSFIPKKAIVPTVGQVRSEPVSVFLIIAIVVFVISLASAGGVFVYKKTLISKINDMNKRLAEAKNSFEPDSIANLSRLSKRIEASKQVVEKHTVVTPVFDLLEDTTLATVRFSIFSYDLSDDGSATLSMTGEAKNFTSVALQSDVIGKEKYVKNPVFSDLNPNSSGNIVFKFSASLDPDLISYKKHISSVIDDSLE